VAHEIIVWDLETVPDLDAYARANGLVGEPKGEIRSAMGEGFPKLIYHSIVCIGALVAYPTDRGYEIQAMGASHIGVQTEPELIEAFVRAIERLNPTLVTFNGGSFDLPVLRYRAMMHGIPAPGMDERAYFHRYRDHHVDLCDVLSSFSNGGKARLDELSRVMGLDGKPDGIDGSRVEEYFNAGRIQEIADYCQSDVVNTYRLWLRHELFRGRLDLDQFCYAEQDLSRYPESRAG
jgi:predicted PolB exonuclease-like 3'-5' exonuclease